MDKIRFKGINLIFSKERWICLTPLHDISQVGFDGDPEHGLNKNIKKIGEMPERKKHNLTSYFLCFQISHFSSHYAYAALEGTMQSCFHTQCVMLGPTSSYYSESCTGLVCLQSDRIVSACLTAETCISILDPGQFLRPMSLGAIWSFQVTKSKASIPVLWPLVHVGASYVTRSPALRAISGLPLSPTVCSARFWN